MRKLILEFDPNEMVRTVQRPVFEHIHSYELLELLRMEYEEGVKIGLMDCYTKGDIPIHDAKLPDFIELVSILRSEGNKHTCIVKVEVPKDFEQMLTEFKLDLIWTTPTIISQEKLTYSCIGDQENILKFIEVMKKYGTILTMSFLKAVYQPHDILSILTDKQREVVLAAQKFGYYDYPKRINSQQLSQKVNISKATLVQHLRKAEGRIMANITAGILSG